MGAHVPNLARPAPFLMRFVYGFAGVLLAFGLVLYPVLALSFSSGAPPTFNGGPNSNGDPNSTCVVCHSSFELNSGDGAVSIEAPSSFVPGETIDIVVTVDNATPPAGGNRQGFELSAQLPDGTHVGTLIVDNEVTQNASGDEDYATHTSAGNEFSSWTIPWTAPVDAPEAVTFYVAGNAANGDGNLTGDYIYTNTLTVPRSTVSNEDETAPLAVRIDAVFPNPFVVSAQVAYTLERAVPVTVTLYDGVGRVVRVLEDGVRGAGAHRARVDAAGLATGVYFVEVRTPEARMTRPLTLGR